MAYREVHSPMVVCDLRFTSDLPYLGEDIIIIIIYQNNLAEQVTIHLPSSLA